MRLKKELIRRADVWICGIAALFLLLFFISEIHSRSPGMLPASPWLRIALLLTVCALFYVGGLFNLHRTGNPSLMRRLYRLFFALYLYLLLTFTLTDKALGRELAPLDTWSEKRAYYLQYFVNFRPFHSIYQIYILGWIKGYINGYYVWLNLLGNACAFMPLALFLPLFFEKQRRWYCFLPTVLGTVVAVEALQFGLMLGSCDVDDLILNVLGATFVFFILKIPPVNHLVQRLFPHTTHS